eukprot:TRINITY_DN4940_c0_g1_i1.p1 TRINITY_DN4940_c0_g1~~TRINITY_DN4940_c0_g1_i1.p1  ORF type:complete len:257 (-),score=75.05 TRINITY_DN4940_c0_g1_i1:37-807(-)
MGCSESKSPSSSSQSTPSSPSLVATPSSSSSSSSSFSSQRQISHEDQPQKLKLSSPEERLPPTQESLGMRPFTGYNYLFKIILVGDSSVGKSSVLKRFTEDVYTGDYNSTIGVDFKIRTIASKGRVIKLQIWDTAGQERYKGLISAYYRGAQGVVIVYDITSLESFENIKKWLAEVDEVLASSSSQIPKMIIGNKADLNELRVIDKEMAFKFAEELDIPLFEASAKDSTNVEQAFFDLVDRIGCDSDNSSPSCDVR